MPLAEQKKQDVQHILTVLKIRLAEKDPIMLATLATSQAATGLAVDQVHSQLVADVDDAILYISSEDSHDGEAFHSRNRLAGLAQAYLNQALNPIQHNDIGDALPAVVNLYGEGNPIVWAPVMVNIFLEHLKPKAPFITATDARSYIKIPEQCTVALLGDWGADNDHAQRIADQVRKINPDFVIHLGDIYYAGNSYECERFLANWPLQDMKASFALNGNHEMYSRGIPYFNIVLKAFQQEASYFTLHNKHWQLHGLDTAYVPFSIDGNVPTPDQPDFWGRVLHGMSHLIPALRHGTFDNKPDASLQTQFDWLVEKISSHPECKNIFLSHNQPVSAYLPEFQAGAFLHDQSRKLLQSIPGGADAIHTWFFGHEHKCTIYSDDGADFRARLVGNGAIPHSRQALQAAAQDETHTSCTPVFTMNNRIVKHNPFGLADLDLAISGFALLTLDGPNASAKYINEDGTLFLNETLTGKPNEVLEWGPGYGPLRTSV